MPYRKPPATPEQRQALLAVRAATKALDLAKDDLSRAVLAAWFAQCSLNDIGRSLDPLASLSSRCMRATRLRDDALLRERLTRL